MGFIGLATSWWCPPCHAYCYHHTQRSASWYWGWKTQEAGDRV